MKELDKWGAWSGLLFFGAILAQSIISGRTFGGASPDVWSFYPQASAIAQNRIAYIAVSWVYSLSFTFLIIFLISLFLRWRNRAPLITVAMAFMGLGALMHMITVISSTGLLIAADYIWENSLSEEHPFVATSNIMFVAGTHTMLFGTTLIGVGSVLLGRETWRHELTGIVYTMILLIAGVLTITALTATMLQIVMPIVIIGLFAFSLWVALISVSILRKLKVQNEST